MAVSAAAGSLAATGSYADVATPAEAGARSAGVESMLGESPAQEDVQAAMAAGEAVDSSGTRAAMLMAEAMDRPARRGVLPRYEGMQSIKEWDRDRWGYRFCKRAFDICFSAGVLTVIAVPSLVLAAAIRLESPGNPFYGQVRVGRTHRDGSLSTFRMWKFRSMYADADERLADLLDENEVSGAMFKMRDDPRVTRIGRFIRRHSIDEFPQFLNVLLGDMSVVGPRPPLPREVEMYRDSDLMRLAVKPGITGWWQVNERSDGDFDIMVRRDLEYIADRGFLTDLKIIAMTVGKVFSGKGAA